MPAQHLGVELVVVEGLHDLPFDVLAELVPGDVGEHGDVGVPVAGWVVGSGNAEQEGAELDLLDLDAQDLGHLEVVQQSLPVVVLREDVPDPRHEQPGELLVQRVDLLDPPELVLPVRHLVVLVEVLLALALVAGLAAGH